MDVKFTIYQFISGLINGKYGWEDSNQHCSYEKDQEERENKKILSKSNKFGMIVQVLVKFIPVFALTFYHDIPPVYNLPFLPLAQCS